MILTITYTQSPATDLGYLLYKNPSRPQTFELNHGKAHIFYPEATKERCTAALILDIDPIDLARGKKGSSGEGGLFDYVNDRPYVASSFLSVAMSRVFGTAMSGKSKDKPELAEKALRLQAKIMMLPCRGEEGIIHRLFEPLGYKVTVEGYMLDEKFPEWGKSKYYTVSLEREVRLQDLLNHIYVLIPVLDSEKHYWVGADEIDKLLRHGEGWLVNHPEKGLITGRYLRRKKSLISQALERLVEENEVLGDEGEQDESSQQEEIEKKLNLNQQRLGTVVAALKSVNAKRVIDIGCGEGNLLSLLLKVLFKFARPQTVIVSTPNKEYNMHYSNLFEGAMRHKDHRFEWSRREFEMWAAKIAENYGYNVKFVQIGDVDNEFGSPTQMGVFT